jgi:hypothetical protein
MRTDHLGGPITGGVTLTLGKYCPDKEKALPVERDSLFYALMSRRLASRGA